MVVAVGDDGNFLAEPIQHGPHQVVGHPQFDGSLLAGEHPKDLLGVHPHVQGVEGFRPHTRGVGHGDVGHLVHPVVLDLFRGGVVGHHVIVLVVPGQGVGADLIPGALFPEHLLLFQVVLEVVELDLPLLGDAVVDGVHVVVDGLVHALDAVHHKDLSV